MPMLEIPGWNCVRNVTAPKISNQTMLKYKIDLITIETLTSL